MNSVKVLINKKQIPLTQYANIDNGTFLIDELEKDSKISVTTVADIIEISSNNYSITDTDTLLYLYDTLGRNDTSYITLMGLITKTDLNIVYNNNIPHTNKTLQNYLKFNSESKFIDLMKRLIKAGVLYQIKLPINNELRVSYMVNPYICRKRKLFNKIVIDVFEDIVNSDISNNIKLLSSTNF